MKIKSNTTNKDRDRNVKVNLCWLCLI